MHGVEGALSNSLTPLTMKWEYHMTDPVPVTKLNELGAEGWELVVLQKTGALIKYIYKRPKK